MKKKRYGEIKKEEMKVNHATTNIRKKLTPKERQFWLAAHTKQYNQTNAKANGESKRMGMDRQMPSL